MEINAIDQLFRSEQSGASTSRRASEPSDKRFSNLLEAHSARARVDRQTQRPSVETARRNDAPNSKPEHIERAEAADRADRAEKGERAKRREQGEQTDRAGSAFNERNSLRARIADAEKASSEKAAAEKVASENPESAEKPLASEQAEAPVPAEAAPEDTAHAAIAQAAEAAKIADETAHAVAKVDEAAAAELLAALALVKLDTPEQIAAPIGAPVNAPVDAETVDAADPKSAPAFGASIPASDTAPDASKAADAKAAKVAVPSEIALPTSTLAEAAGQAEPTTEAYADFLLRNPLTPTALPAPDAGKEAAKAESDAKEGKLIVTMAQPAATAAPVAPVTAFAVQAVVSNDNASLDANLTAARMPVEAEDAKAPAKPGEQTNLFAQNLDAARATQATEGPKPVARTPLVPPHEQVAVHIRKAVSDGLDQISIRLNPAELGRIDIKLDLRADGTLRAAFAADRQQTLEMLKSDSRQLENALSEAGLRADAGGLNFSLRGDNRENSQAFRDMGAQFAERRNADNGAETAAPAIAAGYVRPRAANGRVDLNA
jgi:flagellar hook-length control protein FliK